MSTQADKTNTGVIFTVVVVGAFAMLSVSLLLAALVRGERRELTETRPDHADLKTVAVLKAQQRQKMAAPAAWKNKAQGTVTLPVEAAMKLVLAEYKADPESASPLIPDGFRLTPEGKLVAFAGAAVGGMGVAPSGALVPVSNAIAPVGVVPTQATVPVPAVVVPAVSPVTTASPAAVISPPVKLPSAPVPESAPAGSH